MKIMVYGLGDEHGIPLARVLRDYGQHSVCGFDVDSSRILDMPLDIPLAPTLRMALLEGATLGFVATPSLASVNRALHDIDGWLYANDPHALYPVVVVTPGLNLDDLAATARMCQRLVIGYAPFNYRPGKAMDRLLTLHRIGVTRVSMHRRQGLLHAVLMQAWTPIDNKIPVVETAAIQEAAR